MTARVPTTLAATFDAISLITGRSVGSLIRESLEQWLVQEWSADRLQTELAEARRAQEAAKEQADALATAGMLEALHAAGRES